jgi:hypothetical protein
LQPEHNRELGLHKEQGARINSGIRLTPDEREQRRRGARGGKGEGVGGNRMFHVENFIFANCRFENVTIVQLIPLRSESISPKFSCIDNVPETGEA